MRQFIRLKVLNIRIYNTKFIPGIKYNMDLW